MQAIETSESFLCIERKLYRARQHFDELAQEVRAYYQSDPGTLEVTTSENGGATVEFIESKPTPARFGLIFGDFLHCLRSSLDYLVWELVASGGGIRTHKHEFPVADKESAFEKAIKDGKLDAISPKALALIRTAQPFQRDDPTSHFLWMLNKLNNINKHRRILLTICQASVGEMPADFPHIKSKIKRFTTDGKTAGEFEAWSCLRVSEDALPQAIEILTAADALFEDTYQLIRQFAPLFSKPTE